MSVCAESSHSENNAVYLTLPNYTNTTYYQSNYPDNNIFMFRNINGIDYYSQSYTNKNFEIIIIDKSASYVKGTFSGHASKSDGTSSIFLSGTFYLPYDETLYRLNYVTLTINNNTFQFTDNAIGFYPIGNRYYNIYSLSWPTSSPSENVIHLTLPSYSKGIYNQIDDFSIVIMSFYGPNGDYFNSAWGLGVKDFSLSLTGKYKNYIRGTFWGFVHNLDYGSIYITGNFHSLYRE